MEGGGQKEVYCSTTRKVSEEALNEGCLWWRTKQETADGRKLCELRGGKARLREEVANTSNAYLGNLNAVQLTSAGAVSGSAHLIGKWLVRKGLENLGHAQPNGGFARITYVLY